LKYVVVAVEYFSMWIEAKPLATITSVKVQKFFWQNIVSRFGVPKAITVDNRTQFDAETFKDLCDQTVTRIHFASVRHPESNRLIERAVGTMLRRRRSCRKKRLSAEVVCMRWPKVPLHEASALQTDLKIE
jgi:hypothetical protein